MGIGSEPFPIRVTTKIMPQMKHMGDISTINGAEIEPVDIITFGSPCQGILRRATAREKELSSLLKTALMRQAEST